MFGETGHPLPNDDQENTEPDSLDDGITQTAAPEEKRIKMDNELMLRRMNRFPENDPDRIEIKHQIAEANKRLVWSVINKHFKLFPDDRAELEAVGFAELVHSIDKFDPAKGFRFSTFASRNIFFAVRTFVFRKENVTSLHIPEREKDVLRQASVAIDEFVQENHREPNHLDLVGIFERLIPETQSKSPGTQATIDQKRADRIRALIGVVDGGETVSLDAPASGEADDSSVRTLLERISDDSSTSEIALSNLDREKIRTASGELSEREREVVELRLGMSGAAPMTYEEIGTRYLVSRERIRQIYKKATEKIERYLKKNNIEIGS